MIRHFYSKIEPNKLLHLIFAPNDEPYINDTGLLRTNIAPENEFLQAAHIIIKNKGHKFKAHIHKEIIRTSNVTQECWLVKSGIIRVTYCDLDGSLLDESLLYPGWMTMTFAGGHNYESMTDDVESYEFKLGPYSGQYDDKEFINETSE